MSNGIEYIALFGALHALVRVRKIEEKVGIVRNFEAPSPTNMLFLLGALAILGVFIFIILYLLPS